MQGGGADDAPEACLSDSSGVGPFKPTDSATRPIESPGGRSALMA